MPKNPERPSSAMEKSDFSPKKSTSSLSDEKEINIKLKISPLRIVKGVFVVLLLIAAFFLGRFTGETPAGAAAEPVLKETSSPGLWDRFLGLFSSSPSPSVEKEIVKEPSPVPEESTASEETKEAPPVAEEPVEEIVEPVEEETNEPTITDYTKVALAIDGVKKEWKETWGKVTYLDYTIKNNEAGTIKPSYLIMTMEGYDDYEKKIPLPPESATIKAGEVSTNTVLVPNGFSYNEITAGNLDNVEITVSLFDATDTAMAHYIKSFDLSG